MARSFPANTQIQKFYEESYDKERDSRLVWYKKTHGDSAHDGGKSRQYEVARSKIEKGIKPGQGLLERLPKETKEPRYNKKITPIADTLASRAPDGRFELTAEMRPVSRGCRSKLYDGFTKEGKGRYQYLVSRYERNPEDKFCFPLLSSWEYGWRLGDVVKTDQIRKPKHGRTRIVADTFYTRTGIPTPVHDHLC